LFPLCLDAVTHTCWSLAGDDNVPKPSHDDLEFANDMEIGKLAFKAKNYRGAELRYRHALGYRPDDPEANFMLAQSLDKLGRNDEAHNAYEDYLKLVPLGTQAESARKALQRLDEKISAKP